jgi:hypothetical protein
MSNEPKDEDLFNDDENLLEGKDEGKGFFARQKYIHSKKEKLRGKIVIIPDGYLDLPFLPHGIINKTETGIGGTSVEAKAKRHSIIVEPLKAIASSKAIAHEGSLYVGSPTNLHKARVTEKNIQDYHSSEIADKKIFVVADSLPRVIKSIGKQVYQDYFLLIDEIDSYQEDASFRGNIEKCIDYYLDFPIEKRALISATINEFSNPSLKEEQFTTYTYQIPSTRKADLILTDNVERCAVETIMRLLESDQKIVIAYNKLLPILSIIEELVNIKKVDPKEIGIMCGEGSKELAGTYSREFENSSLPSKITFKTSAYFSGIDINEQYHLVSIVNTKYPYTMLSVNKFKQIAGRCRHKEKLFSETIIFNRFMDELELFERPADYYIGLAQKDLSVFNCIKILNGRDTQRKYIDLKKVIYEFLNKKEDLLSLIRQDYNDEYAVSYFKIDRLLEIYNTHQIYSKLGLREALVGHGVDVNKKEEIFNDSSELEVSAQYKKLKSEQIKKAFDTLVEIKQPNKQDIKKLIIDSRTSRFEMAVYDQYSKVVGYVDHNDFIEHVKKIELSSKANFLKFNNLIKALTLKSLPSNHKLKQKINNVFDYGRKYGSKEIVTRMARIFYHSIDEAHGKETELTRLFKILFETQRGKIKIAGKYVTSFQIIGEAYPNIKILKYSELTNDDPSIYM